MDLFLSSIERPSRTSLVSPACTVLCINRRRIQVSHVESGGALQFVDRLWFALLSVVMAASLILYNIKSKSIPSWFSNGCHIAMTGDTYLAYIVGTGAIEPVHSVDF